LLSFIDQKSKSENMRLIAFIICSALTYSMVAQSGFNIKKGGHAYTIEIPEYMERTYDLNQVATLQYANLSKPAYVIVIDDNKAELKHYDIFFADARDFLTSFLDGFNLDTEHRKIGEIITYSVGGNNYAQAQMRWSEPVTDIFMLITAMETPTHFYKILCWTTPANKDELIDDFIRISSSLKDER